MTDFAKVLGYGFAFLLGLGSFSLGFINAISIGGPSECYIRVDMFISAMLAAANSTGILSIMFWFYNEKMLPPSNRIHLKELRRIYGHSRKLFGRFADMLNLSPFRTKYTMHYVMITPLLLMPWLLLLQMLFHSSSCPDSTNVTSGQKAYYWSVTGISLFVSLVESVRLCIAFRTEQRRMGHLGVQKSSEIRERDKKFRLAMGLLENPNSIVSDLIHSVHQEGYDDDLTVAVQLKFWLRFGSWRLNSYEENRFSERNISCKVCECLLEKSSVVVCIPMIFERGRILFGHHKLLGNHDLQTSLIWIDAKNMIEELVHPRPPQICLDILAIQKGVWTQKEPRRSASGSQLVMGRWPQDRRPEDLGEIIHYSFLHRKCFESKLLSPRSPQEPTTEILPSTWRSSLDWIEAEFDLNKANPVQSHLYGGGNTVWIPRFFGILDKQVYQNPLNRKTLSEIPDLSDLEPNIDSDSS